MHHLREFGRLGAEGLGLELSLSEYVVPDVILAAHLDDILETSGHLQGRRAFSRISHEPLIRICHEILIKDQSRQTLVWISHQMLIRINHEMLISINHLIHPNVSDPANNMVGKKTQHRK